MIISTIGDSENTDWEIDADEALEDRDETTGSLNSLLTSRWGFVDAELESLESLESLEIVETIDLDIYAGRAGSDEEFNRMDGSE